jgi:hypothetical protein
MTKDEIFEKIKNDNSKIYGQPIFDMFLQLSDDISYKHFSSLPDNKKRLVNNFYGIVQELIINSRTKELEELLKFKKEFQFAHGHYSGAVVIINLIKLCYAYGRGGRELIQILMKIVNKSNLSYLDLLRLFNFFADDYDQIGYLNALKDHFGKLPDHAVIAPLTKKYEYHADKTVTNLAKLLKDEIPRISDHYTSVLLESISNYVDAFEETAKYIDFSKLDESQILMLLIFYGTQSGTYRLERLCELLGNNIKKLKIGGVEYLLNYDNRKIEYANYPIETYKKIISKYYN